MDNLMYMLFVSVSIPLFFMILLVEKKSRLPIVFMFVGIFVALFAAEVNGFLYKTLSIELHNMTATIIPVNEELFKALPILYYALVISDKREKLFTASMATGIGFALLENAFYLINYSNLTMVAAIIRAIGSGLMHGMCTLLIGVGISFVKKKRKLFAVGTFGLLSTAIVYHGVYNILIHSQFSIVGTLLPIATYIPFLVWRLRIKHRLNQTPQKT